MHHLPYSVDSPDALLQFVNEAGKRLKHVQLLTNDTQFIHELSDLSATRIINCVRNIYNTLVGKKASAESPFFVEEKIKTLTSVVNDVGDFPISFKFRREQLRPVRNVLNKAGKLIKRGDNISKIIESSYYYSSNSKSIMYYVMKYFILVLAIITLFLYLKRNI